MTAPAFTGLTMPVQAAKLLSRLPGNILLTTGANTAHVYVNGIEDFNERGYIRVLDTEASVAACQSAGICSDHILACRPPFTVEDNLAAIKKYNIRILVTKDSGAAGGVPQKLESIRQAGITGVILRRPGRGSGGKCRFFGGAFCLAEGPAGAGKRGNLIRGEELNIMGYKRIMFAGTGSGCGENDSDLCCDEGALSGKEQRSCPLNAGRIILTLCFIPILQGKAQPTWTVFYG